MHYTMRLLVNRLVVLTCVMLGVAGNLAAQDVIPPATLQKLKQATVLIRAETGDVAKSGTGFLLGKIGNTGFIATNAHVVSVPTGDGEEVRVAKTIRVVFDSGTGEERELRTQVVALDPFRDLAILHVADTRLPERINSNKPVTPGETQSVFILGFPFGDALAVARKNPAITVSRAAVSSIRRDAYDQIVTIQIDGSINPGNSGGPIVTKSGDLVGVAVAKVKGTQIGWVIPAAQARDMLLGRVTMLSFKLAAVQDGVAHFAAEGFATDPLSKLTKISLLVCTPDDVKRDVAPTRSGAWGQVARRVETFDMAHQDGLVSARFTLAASDEDSAYIVQPVFQRGDGERVFMEPAKLLLPGRSRLVVGSEPETVSIRTGGGVDWYVRLQSRPVDVASTPKASAALEALPKHVLRGHTDSVLSLAFSANGETLASAGMDQSVRLWDVDRGRELHTGKGHKSWIWSVAISPDHRVVASGGGFDKVVKLWDPTSGSPLGDLAGHTGKVRGIAISPDSKWLVSTSDDRTARVWDLAARQTHVKVDAHQSVVLSAAVSPDGKQFATGGSQEIAVWNLPSGTKKASWPAHEKGVLTLVFSPDGKSLASASSDKQVKLWDVATHKLNWEFQNATEARSVAFVDRLGVLAVTDGKLVRLLDAASGKEAFRFEAHDDESKCVAASPAGSVIATAGKDRVVKLWELKRLP